MLDVEGLAVSYGRIAAVRDVSLTVDVGEIVGLIGPNGAGKSTTLMAIIGMVAPQAGSIRLEGETILGLTPERIARKGVAIVPEGRRIFATLTVGENMSLGATARQSRNDLAGVLQGIRDRFPILGEYWNTPAGKLSGGEQQQLAIGRALVSRPRLLLMDEPSLGLAPLLVNLVFETLDTLRREGMTILLVEQNAKRTLELADRTYVLRSGAVELSGARDELLGTIDIASAYLGADDGP